MPVYFLKYQLCWFESWRTELLHLKSSLHVNPRRVGGPYLNFQKKMFSCKIFQYITKINFTGKFTEMHA